MKVFLVVGMHRSATSLVAKGLHEAGVHMGGDLLGAMRSNPYGHYEDRPAIAINDRILANAGGAWDHPPPHGEIAAIDGSEVAEYVERRSDRPQWGVKDPRLSLTWPVWLPHLDGDLHVVWARRSRRQVAESLWRRDGTPVDRGGALAAIYEERIGLLMEATA